ncbi:hypothetical protein CLONEX_04245 [[Clostridium] nexile DSM 1787]|nr:hypothetical protein CLONEX_04245 [[Clostridium] nexile DSM 1787]
MTLRKNFHAAVRKDLIKKNMKGLLRNSLNHVIKHIMMKLIEP